MRLCSLFFSVGPDVPFVAVYKTQRDGEREMQDQESECQYYVKDITGDLATH